MKIFVAGATGAIGRRLVPQLVGAGHEVVATTRTADKLRLLEALGSEPVILDGLDARAVGEAVGRAEPDVVIHQMTALAAAGNLRRFDRDFAVTNELRTAGLDHLLAAAVAAGAQKFIAQSYTGWPNSRSGGLVKTEDDPLDPEPPAAQRQSLRAIRHVEQAVLDCAGLVGIALRYGSLYGPGASDPITDLVKARKVPVVGSGAGIWSFLHIDDAASATVAAVQHGTRGIYNVCDDEPAPVAEWLPYLAETIEAKPPRRVPVWLGRLAGGEVTVSMMTQIRGSSNLKAKTALQWEPRWRTWRDGFRAGLTDEARYKVEKDGSR
ncbi:NAD-dependent epimerase/dehydratase family protein [Jatrophihabitans sp. DSM 45814]